MGDGVDDSGWTVVMVTHDLDSLYAICDRVAVMYAGRIVEEAAVDDLYASPQHPYTRGLLASLPVLGAAGGLRADLAVIPGLPPAAHYADLDF